VARHRVELVDRLEALLPVGEVDAEEVDQHVELRVGLELPGEVGKDVAAHDPRRLIEPVLRLDAPLGELRADRLQLRSPGVRQTCLSDWR
jgi:hypothetical protein